MDVVKFSRCTGSDSRGSLGPRDSISRSCIGIGIAVKYARGISFTFFHKFLRDFYPNIREIFINVISNDFFFFFCDSRNFFQVNSTFIYFCKKIRIRSFKICIDFCISFDYSDRLNFSQNSFTSGELILLTFQKNSGDSIQF